jgi:hypothetical protein
MVAQATSAALDDSSIQRSLTQTPPESSSSSNGGISVAIGGVPCSNVVVRSASSITCETGKPPGGPGQKPQGPQPVVVTVEVSSWR